MKQSREQVRVARAAIRREESTQDQECALCAYLIFHGKAGRWSHYSVDQDNDHAARPRVSARPGEGE